MDEVFPGGLVVKNWPDVGLISDPGRSRVLLGSSQARAPHLGSPCVTARSYWAHTRQSLCPTTREANSRRNPCTAMKRRHWRKPSTARKKTKKHSPKQINTTCTKEYARKGKYFTAWTSVLVSVIKCRYDCQITLLKHQSFLLTLGFLVDHQLVWPQKQGHKMCQAWWRKTCVLKFKSSFYSLWSSLWNSVSRTYLVWFFITWKCWIIFLGSDQMEKIKNVLEELLMLGGFFSRSFFIFI